MLFQIVKPVTCYGGMDLDLDAIWILDFGLLFFNERLNFNRKICVQNRKWLDRRIGVISTKLRCK